MFLEDHLLQNLTTTMGLIKHLEDMEVQNNSYKYYQHQRSILEEQKIYAEQVRKEYNMHA